MPSWAFPVDDTCSACAGVIVSGIALVRSCRLREAVQLTDSLKTPGKADLPDEQEPLMQVWNPSCERFLLQQWLDAWCWERGRALWVLMKWSATL